MRQALAIVLLGLFGAGCASEAARRGRRALDEGAYALASAELSRAVQERPEELSYWVDLGRARIGEGRGREAAEAFTRARALSPKEARLAIYLGHAEELARQYDAAERAYRAAVALAPERAWPRRVLGARLLRWGRAEEAIPWLREAIALDPEHAETHHALAIALAQAGQKSRAEAALRDALVRFPRERALLLSLSALLIERQAYAEALEVYAQVVRLWPAFAPAHVGRAILLARLRRPQEAQAALDEAVRLDPRAEAYRAQLTAP